MSESQILIGMIFFYSLTISREMLLILFTIEFATEDTALAKVAKSRKVIWFIAIKLLKVESVSKFIHPKYYKHLRKGAHQNHLGRQKMGWFHAD